MFRTSGQLCHGEDTPDPGVVTLSWEYRSCKSKLQKDTAETRVCSRCVALPLVARFLAVHAAEEKCPEFARMLGQAVHKMVCIFLEGAARPRSAGPKILVLLGSPVPFLLDPRLEGVP